jgi:hypothetical protein
MGAAERVETSDLDPCVEFGAWEGEEATEPWCVDDGANIAVMRTRDIRDGLRTGGLSPEHKVWRDGRACWVAAGEVYELVVDQDPEAQSRIRRIQRPAHAAAGRPGGWWRRTLMMVFGGVLLGLGTMAWLLPDTAAQPAPASQQPAASRVASR